MVLFDNISGQALSVTEVQTETNTLYAQEMGSLKAWFERHQDFFNECTKNPYRSKPATPIPDSEARISA